MRVIAGTARSLVLVTPAGRETRPTTDRIKETLFNILQPRIPGSRFFDLFAGSGGIGIEALSRGAEFACFADVSRDAIACVRTNLAHTKFTDRAEVYATDALSAIRRMRSEGRVFDIAFLDPPYGKGLEITALAALRQEELLAEDGVAIIETTIGADLTPYLKAGYRVSRIKEYKSNQHLFLTVWRGDL